MEISPRDLNREQTYKLMVGAIVPRPVAWITSLSPEGRVNAAPFSAFTLLSQDPPVVLFQANRGLRGGPDPIEKDTARNVRLTGEFVVNIPNEDTLEAMHACSTPLPPEQSEPEVFGIELAPSRIVKPPRIAAAPICFECRLMQHFDIGHEPHTVFIGEVVHFYVSDAVQTQGAIDPNKLRPVARIGGPWYAKLGELVYLPVPKGPVPEERSGKS